MDIQQIVFTEKNVAKFLKNSIPLPDNEKYVVVRTAISTISSGTERANISGDPNVSVLAPKGIGACFPRYGGYSSAGTVVSTGKDVTKVKIGDRVAMSTSTHCDYNVLDESRVLKIPSDNLSFSTAALSFIATFSLAAVRKTRVELGESSLVMGLGVLGQLAVYFLKCAGSVPVIVADPIKEKREKALELGADYALDPFEEEFADKVKELTGGGANVAIEVTGNGAALNGALDCMSKLGRIALLGCTRDENFTIDYYRKVHGPGISLIGAHTNARPDFESYPGYFTIEDDMITFMKLCDSGRIDASNMIDEVHSPNECEEIYHRLITEPNFPVIQFDWDRLE